VIIGVAGDTGHGKTTLVRALAQGAAPPAVAVEGEEVWAGALCFLDPPGHPGLVPALLSASGGIDAVALVVAADAGVTAATREQAAILDGMGIDRGVVAVTRTDQAPDRAGPVVAEVRALLAGGGLADAVIVPVSALTGEGIAALRASLLALHPLVRAAAAWARLAVERVRPASGGAVEVTGTLRAGRIAWGDGLLLSPRGSYVKVGALRAAGRAMAVALAGQRLTVELAGPEAALAAAGDWLLHPALHAPTMLMDARVRLRAEERLPGPGEPVRLHLGAAQVPARLAALDGLAAPDAAALVRVTLAEPLAALALDSFVLRDAAGRRTLGGGMVLDPWPPRRAGREPERLAQLVALSQDAGAALRSLLRAGWIDFGAFVRARNLPPAGQAAALAAAGAIRMAGLAVTTAQMARLRAALIEVLAARHRDHPDQPGLTMQRLRLLLPDAPPAALVGPLVEAALRDGAIRQEGRHLSLVSHSVRLSARQERLWRLVRGVLAGARFDPPGVPELAHATGAQPVELRALLKRLSALSWLEEVAPDRFFLRDAVAGMARLAGAVEAQAGTVGLAAFAGQLGVGEAAAARVLDFFDSIGLTRLDGEVRRVRPELRHRFDDALEPPG